MILKVNLTYEISYSKTFEKKFSKYDRKLQEKIFNAIQNLPDGDVKRLTGNDIPPIYRIRILFYMNEEEIQILKVDSRGDIYK